MDDLEPLEAAVLVAVGKGLDDPAKIAEVLRVRREDVENVIERLVSKGLIERREKRGIFKRKVELRLTEKGYNLLPKALVMLEKLAKQVSSSIGVSRSERLETPPDFTLLAPFLVWLGLLPVELLLVAGIADDIYAWEAGSTERRESDTDDSGADVDMEGEDADSDGEEHDLDIDIDYEGYEV